MNLRLKPETVERSTSTDWETERRWRPWRVGTFVVREVRVVEGGGSGACLCRPSLLVVPVWGPHHHTATQESYKNSL